MNDTTAQPDSRGAGRMLRLDLSPDELELVVTALRMLEDTLGREEAEELRQVQAVLARIVR